MGSCDFVIPTYAKKAEGETTGGRTIEKSVIIKGGAGVAFSDAERAKKNQTSVLTVVSGSDYDLIKENPVFKQKLAAGFIKVGSEPTELKTDKSAQITEAQLKRKNKSIKATTDEVE